MTPEQHEQVTELYRAALELEPARRAAYLAAACGGDEALRREVTSLLGYEAQSGGLIDRPALEAAARLMDADQVESLIGQQVGHCRVLALLGKGGMGEVYLAEDVQLGRKVAVKLLPAEFTTQPERVRRFAQEARAASALNHPNIITIHEIGQAATKDGSTHYIVTEYVTGETLRQRLANAPQQQIEPSAAIDLAAQIAAALAAAHEAGITHRDIKPENVMVRRDGIVKVLDFGLAKLIEPSAPVMDTQAPTAPDVSTEAGIVMGTPRYMSPEQARGEKADARTDIFSLGVMLYEMIAGRPPFAGATTSETIAAILRDEPPPLTSHAPDAPPELERIVGQALRKHREERYQTAQALLDDLNQLKERLLVEKFVVPPADGSSRRRTLPPAGGITNQRRRTAIIAVAALIIAAIASLPVWFYLNRRPALTAKDTILLADFDNQTGEAIFDKTLKQGLAMQLQQAPFKLFSETQIRHELLLMQRPPSERVTAELAREICVRKNLKAFITGVIAPLGSHYVMTLEAVSGQQGEVTIREQVQAESKEQVLRALAQAALRLRERLGESLSSMQHADRRHEEATTGNLEAFQFYTQGQEQSVRGDFLQAILAYQRAVELDPTFAYAWSLLALMHKRSGQPEAAAACAEKAYALRDRVSEREHLRITFIHHFFVTGNMSRRLETLRLQQRMFPGSMDNAHLDFAVAYLDLGQFEQASAEARESIRLLPTLSPAYQMLAIALFRLNRFAQAEEVSKQAAQLNLDADTFHALRYQWAFINGDSAAMQQQVEWARGKPNEHWAWDAQAQTAAFAGQWRKAQELSRSAIDLAAQSDQREVAARYATEQALRNAALGVCQDTKTSVAQGLAFGRGRLPLKLAALALALCGASQPAQSLADELTKRFPEDTISQEIWLPTIRAALELQRGNAEQAIEQLQPVARYEAAAEFWPQYLRGQAYLKLRQGAEAATEFQKVLDHRGHAPLSPLYPLAHLGLARAAALTGDAAQSSKSYEDFFAVWKEAEVDLPILSDAKSGREKR